MPFTVKDAEYEGGLEITSVETQTFELEQAKLAKMVERVARRNKANNREPSSESTKPTTTTTPRCTAEAVSTTRIVLPPNSEIAINAEIKHQSTTLHRTQCFTVESVIGAEIRGNLSNPDNDIETSFKKLMGVVRLIPRALVAPSWAKDTEKPTVCLRLENRGTEYISIEPGQTLAKLEELRFDSEDGDDIISLENLEEEGISPMELARGGKDGDILGSKDWRTSLSGRRIIKLGERRT